MRALDHVQVTMPPGGEDDARAFYGGLLGLTEVEKPEPLRAQGGVWFAEGIHVSGEDGFSASRRAHPAIRVDDLDRLAEAFTAAGCHLEWDERWPGVRQFYARDPFGNRLELLADRPRFGIEGIANERPPHTTHAISRMSSSGTPGWD